MFAKERIVAKRSPLAERLADLKDRIGTACEKANRKPEEITLIAVTKNAAPEQVREILQLGVGDLGESRVQVLTQRAAQINEFYQRQQGRAESPMPARLRWHMIGHLQRNKIKPVLSVVDVIQSVDSLRLAEELDAQAQRAKKVLPILLQVNASEEINKFGVAVGAALHLAEQIDTMPGLRLIGLMTMAPLTHKPKEARAVFARTRELLEEMRWHKIGGTSLRHLSMGMSNDFEQAILEGATMLRIGSSLFGGKSADQDDVEEGPDAEARLRKKIAEEPERED